MAIQVFCGFRIIHDHDVSDIWKALTETSCCSD